jgi:hypothetical protein
MVTSSGLRMKMASSFSNRWFIPSKLHGVTSQKVVIILVTAVIISNLTYLEIYSKTSTVNYDEIYWSCSAKQDSYSFATRRPPVSTALVWLLTVLSCVLNKYRKDIGTNTFYAYWHHPATLCTLRLLPSHQQTRSRTSWDATSSEEAKPRRGTR